MRSPLLDVRCSRAPDPVLPASRTRGGPPQTSGLASADVDRSVLLLLPEPLEAFAHQRLVEDLLATGMAVAVDPPRVSYARQARLPFPVAHRQARRLRKRLRQDPRAVVIFAPTQYPLARALLSQMQAGELWYEHTAGAAAPQLHELAADRARLRFEASDRDALEAALQRLAG